MLGVKVGDYFCLCAVLVGFGAILLAKPIGSFYSVFALWTKELMKLTLGKL